MLFHFILVFTLVLGHGQKDVHFYHTSSELFTATDGLKHCLEKGQEVGDRTLAKLRSLKGLKGRTTPPYVTARVSCEKTTDQRA